MPRRTGNLFPEIVDRDNLRLAFYRACRGKRARTTAREFSADLEDRLSELADELIAGTFLVGRQHQFVILDPKERIITAPCFAERVLHHAIMTVCDPVFERWLIADTYACRRGRGRIAALRRAQVFARRHAAYLKLDIRKYFDSIPHGVLLARLERLFKDARLLDLFSRIISAYRGNLGKGLPIGSLTSQHFANFYLGWFDRFVKEGLRVGGYVRYMDDMVLWGESPRSLQRIERDCERFLNDELSLELKPFPFTNWTAHGMDFLGCRVRPRRLELNRRSRLRFARKLRLLERRFVAGQIGEAELQVHGTALVAFARAGGTESWQFRHGLLQTLPVSGQ